MARTDNRWIVLLRGVNVGGHRKLPMAELRTTLGKAGFGGVRTYIASGNVLLDAAMLQGEVEAQVERAIEAQFGSKVEAIARSAEQWATYARQDPFPDAVPKLLHLCLAKAPLHESVVDTITPRCLDGERVKRIGDALWIDFGPTLAHSKVTPAVLDRSAGSSVTARNRNTVLTLAEMADA